MKRILCVLGILSLVATSLSGCWDLMEITDLSVVTCLFIDEGDEPGTIALGALVNQGKTKGSSSNVALSNIAEIGYLTTGNSVFECLMQLEIESTHSLFLQQTHAIVIGSSLAEEGLVRCLDFFLRDNQCRLDTWLFIAEGKASELMEANIDKDDSVTVALTSIMYKPSKLDSYRSTTLLDFYTTLMDDASSPLLPIASILHESDNDTFAVKAMAILKDGRMVGKLESEEMQGYNCQLGELTYGRISTDSDHGQATFIMSAKKSHIVPHFGPSNEVTFDISITAEVYVVDVFEYKNAGERKRDELLIEDAKKEIERLMLKAFSKAQSLSTDIYGYGKYIYTRHPDKWSELKADWPEIFANLNVNISLDVKMPYDQKFNLPLDIKEIRDYGKTT